MNYVFIATSIDGYIADREGKIDWLPEPDGLDYGFDDFMKKIDALIMGKNTFIMVDSFDCPWPYSKHVFVASNSLKELAKKYDGKVTLLNGTPTEILKTVHNRGFKNLYIDGGVNIQNFLKQDLVDELIITTVPVVLGGGKPLFGDLNSSLNFKHIETQKIGDLIKNHYIREKDDR